MKPHSLTDINICQQQGITNQITINESVKKYIDFTWNSCMIWVSSKRMTLQRIGFLLFLLFLSSKPKQEHNMMMNRRPTDGLMETELSFFGFKGWCQVLALPLLCWIILYYYYVICCRKRQGSHHLVAVMMMIMMILSFLV